MSIPLHPRTAQVNAARAVILETVNRVALEYDLTYAELAMILSGELYSRMCDAVKQERA